MDQVKAYNQWIMMTLLGVQHEFLVRDMLLETGDKLLLETGSLIILEDLTP